MDTKRGKSQKELQYLFPTVPEVQRMVGARDVKSLSEGESLALLDDWYANGRAVPTYTLEQMPEFSDD